VPGVPSGRPWQRGERRASLGPRLALLAALAAAGCGQPSSRETIPLGLMLSYTGYLAANSVNSERALTLAIEAANAAGGVGGKPLEILARNTRSDDTLVSARARELLEAGVPLVIGPDTIDFVTQLRTLMRDRVLILPSFATASDVEFKPGSWFVMGPGTGRVACELAAQLRADGREKPLVIVNSTGYNGWLTWELTNRYGWPRVVLPADQDSSKESVRPITSVEADAFVLAAYPASAASLLYALLAIGELDDPGRWYLSPTLHTPAFFQTSPRRALQGARGVAPGTGSGAGEFAALFQARWRDQPLDDAYPFYDAGAVAALAIERALVQDGVMPTHTELSAHIIAVTHAGGERVSWNEIDRGLTLVRQGVEIEYVGVSGTIQFDLSGQTPGAQTRWWTIADEGFRDLASPTGCQ
jgi:ABC-type branched-subunit amino acid transport system substrate-binding protein